MSHNAVMEITNNKMLMKNVLSIADFQKCCCVRASHLSCIDYFNHLYFLNLFILLTLVDLLMLSFLIPLTMKHLFSCLTDAIKNINNMEIYHIMS